jgi:hypothetical protein
MGFVSYLEDIIDRKDDCSDRQTKIDQLPRPPIVIGLSPDEVVCCIFRIASAKEDMIKELRHLEMELNRLNEPYHPLLRLSGSPVPNPRDPLSKSGKERETVRRQIHRLRERIERLEESKQRLLAEQKKLSE